ncbi:hypothetical protein [Azonexus hydrophilus]|uniref:Uncharacterized protein n=1 Tax=Azonexus hydrophilus TaxID=418702 RepID=A0ABZ2XNG2_9RHOO
MTQEKLFELVDDLNNSASGEGCSDDLMVVGATELWNLTQHVRLLKKAAEANQGNEIKGA